MTIIFATLVTFLLVVIAYNTSRILKKVSALLGEDNSPLIDFSKVTSSVKQLQGKGKTKKAPKQPDAAVDAEVNTPETEVAAEIDYSVAEAAEAFLTGHASVTMLSDRSDDDNIKACYKVDNYYLILDNDKLAILDGTTMTRIVSKFNKGTLVIDPKDIGSASETEGVVESILGGL